TRRRATARRVQPGSSSSRRAEELSELRLELRAQLGADVDDLRESARELLLVRDARVDQDAVVEIPREVQRIALRRPRFLDQVDVARGIEARAHRPQHLVEVARVYVLVDHHGPLARVGAAMAVLRDMLRILFMSLSNLSD